MHNLIKNQLGSSEIEVTKMGYGAWALGSNSYGEVDRNIAESCISTYLDLGGNFIDTARAYAVSEERIGELLHRLQRRKSVVIASKSGKLEASEIQEELETSLRNLKTDYIDLYYLHNPPEDIDKMNELLDLFEQFKREGKIRSIGASIKGPNVTQATVDLCRQYIDSGRIDAIQLIYSIFRQKNSEIFSYAKNQNVSIIARTSLENGFLTGKYDREHQFTVGDHRNRWTIEKRDIIFKYVEDLKEAVVKTPYETLTQAALRFVYENESVTAMIPGGKSPKQIKGNMAVQQLPELKQIVSADTLASFAVAINNFNIS